MFKYIWFLLVSLSLPMQATLFLKKDIWNSIDNDIYAIIIKGGPQLEEYINLAELESSLIVDGATLIEGDDEFTPHSIDYIYLVDHTSKVQGNKTNWLLFFKQEDGKNIKIKLFDIGSIDHKYFSRKDDIMININCADLNGKLDIYIDYDAEQKQEELPDYKLHNNFNFSNAYFDDVLARQYITNSLSKADIEHYHDTYNIYIEMNKIMLELNYAKNYYLINSINCNYISEFYRYIDNLKLIKEKISKLEIITELTDEINYIVSNTSIVSAINAIKSKQEKGYDNIEELLFDIKYLKDINESLSSDASNKSINNLFKLGDDIYEIKEIMLNITMFDYIINSDVINKFISESLVVQNLIAIKNKYKIECNNIEEFLIDVKYVYYINSLLSYELPGYLIKSIDSIHGVDDIKQITSELSIESIISSIKRKQDMGYDTIEEFLFDIKYCENVEKLKNYQLPNKLLLEITHNLNSLSEHYPNFNLPKKERLYPLQSANFKNVKILPFERDPGILDIYDRDKNKLINMKIYFDSEGKQYFNVSEFQQENIESYGICGEWCMIIDGKVVIPVRKDYPSNAYCPLDARNFEYRLILRENLKLFFKDYVEL